MSKSLSKEELRKKLRENIQKKKAGRMTKVQRKRKVDDFSKKMGMSESDMKALAELSETIRKKMQK
jgi:hypothetical protein